MGEIAERLRSLEARQEQLVAAKARAEAGVERAQSDMDSAQARLSEMGFATAEEAEQFLQQASAQITEQITELEKILTDAGV